MSYFTKYLKYKIKYIKYINNVNKLKGGTTEYIEGLRHINNGQIQLAIKKFEEADRKNDNMARQHLFDIYTIGREGILIDLDKANQYLEKITDPRIKEVMITLSKYYYGNKSDKNSSIVNIEKLRNLLTPTSEGRESLFNNNKYVKYMNFIIGIVDIEELKDIQDEHELSLIALGNNYKKLNDFNQAITYYKKAAERNLLEGIFKSGEITAEDPEKKEESNIFFNRVICDSNFKLDSISDFKQYKIFYNYYEDMKINAEYWLIKLGKYEYKDCILNIDFTNDKFIIDVSNINYQMNIVQEVLYSLTMQNTPNNKLKGHIIHSYTSPEPIFMNIKDLNEIYFKREEGKQEPAVVDQTVSAAINYEAINLKGTLYVFSGDGNCKIDGLKGKNYFAIYRSVKNVVENNKKVCIVSIENSLNNLYINLANINKNLTIMFLSDFIKSTINPNKFLFLTLQQKENISKQKNPQRLYEICPSPPTDTRFSSRPSSPSPDSRSSSRSPSPPTDSRFSSRSSSPPQPRG